MSDQDHDVRLEDGTTITRQLLSSLWEMERRGYVFDWNEGRGLVIKRASWVPAAPLTPRPDDHPARWSSALPRGYFDEPGWEPLFVLDHLEQIEVLVRYQASHPTC
jgi:hypothetical protein